MTFLERIFTRLEQAATAPVLREIRDGRYFSVTGGELLALVGQARNFLAAHGLKKGDCCALLAPNRIRWAAIDLAMMAESLIVVPLYARQAPAELVTMIKDAAPSLICCSDPALAAEIQKIWPDAPPVVAFDAIFAGESSAPAPPYRHADHDAVTIIYTSGTSGEPKGVVLNAANVTYMLGCTNARLDQLMSLSPHSSREPERIFHYLPFCFAASWIALLTFLSRDSILSLSTDLAKLSDELKLAAPNYFLNVPTLLERVRTRIEESISKRGGWAVAVFTRAKREYLRRRGGESRLVDAFCLWLASAVMFPAVRKSIGPNLKALISGSAPLAPETQLFYMMLGIPVLQVYGLTETTAICTMDDPRHVEPGRVGPAIPGLEMTLAESGEILVRGPNIFPGYWQRPAETAKALEGGWFHTGDQGEVDANGNWRITGRLKNLIVLNSGHNVAPEPLEQALAERLPEAQQVMLLGNQRSFLAALVTTAGANGSHGGLRTDASDGHIQSVVDAVNAGLPHYKQIRAFHVVPEPFSIENGLLTANGKLKRDAISARFAAEIERLYQRKAS
jgi:long-chain acyl-CoA synthetase